MSYAVPRPTTVGSAVVQLCNADEHRTSITFANVSTETKYISSRRDVMASGNMQGIPIYANSKVILDEQAGSDPTLDYYGIGTADGTVIVFEEKVGGRGNKTDRILGDINGTLKSLVALLMKTR